MSHRVGRQYVQTIGRQEKGQSDNFTERMTWYMRWYLVIFVTVLYTISLTIGVFVWVSSKDYQSLFLFTPTVLMPLVHYLVPMDQKRYELKKLRIQAMGSRLRQKRTRLS